MCFYFKLSKDAVELENRFNANFKLKNTYKAKDLYNGFENPQTPIILSKNTNEINFGEWGLIPSWAKDNSFQKNTLNAQVETLKEKPSYKDVYFQRCLIISNGFYEWQWLDEKGKNKQKYLITNKDEEIFTFAGLWSIWINPIDNSEKITYTIITTKADSLMEKIHNHKKRMPVILEKSNELRWLLNQKILSNKVNLDAVKHSN